MRTGFCAALITVTFGLALPTGQNRQNSSNRIAELQEWMAVVARHTPGRVDESVSAMRSWGRESLQSVRDDLAAIRLLLCERCPRPQQADHLVLNRCELAASLRGAPCTPRRTSPS